MTGRSHQAIRAISSLHTPRPWRYRWASRLSRCVALMLLLSACAPNTPAPVVSLEQRSQTVSRAPMQQQVTNKRPARYRVKKGDTLYSIAWRYGLDYKRLARWNAIKKPFAIFVGQTLSLSPPKAKSVRKPVTTTASHHPPATKTKPLAVGAEPKPIPRKSAPPSKPAPAQKPKPPVVAAASPAKPSAPETPAPRVSENGPLDWIWPTRGAVIQTFHKDDRTRQGIRISGKPGQAVIAAEGGKVVYSGSGLPGYGKLIIIKHNKNYLSAYGFNSKLLVRDGEQVARGERVAEMGQSADGKALLHFEIRRRDRPLNPQRLLPR